MSKNIYMSTESIESLISVKKTLEIIEIYVKDITAKENVMTASLSKAIIDARQKVMRVLKAECRHDYAEDDFDIDTDTTKRVTYCNLCESTF
jgi:hypothetical protein